jgi:hypothetical protein
MPKPTPEDKYQADLLLSRRILRDEMQRAMRATLPVEKRELVGKWKAAYSPLLVNDLLSVAKDPEARQRIANWNLDGFDNQRRKNK